ncbi:MAG: hypothetical protein ACRD0J_03595, partial [Acidimicrobiales bacterium]
MEDDHLATLLDEASGVPPVLDGLGAIRRRAGRRRARRRAGSAGLAVVVALGAAAGGEAVAHQRAGGVTHVATSPHPGATLFSRTLPSGLRLTVSPRAGHPGQVAITLGHLSAVGSSTKTAVAPYAGLAVPGTAGLVAVTGATMTDLGAGRAVIVAVVHTSPAIEGLRLTASPVDGTPGPADTMTPVRGLAVLAVTVSHVHWGHPPLRPSTMAVAGQRSVPPVPLARFSLAVTGSGGKLLSKLVAQAFVERPLVCADNPNISTTTTSAAFGRAAPTTVAAAGTASTVTVPAPSSPVQRGRPGGHPRPTPARRPPPSPLHPVGGRPRPS